MNKKLNRKLDLFRKIEKTRHAIDEIRMRDIKYPPKYDIVIKRKYAGKIRSASLQDYKDWLFGFMLQGGEPTHCYSYPMRLQLRDFFVVIADLELDPLYGAKSINVIVPKGVNVIVKDRGHNTLYYMDGFKVEGHYIPIFSDISFD